MSVKNTQKTVKKIWKNLENTKGYENFQPNWNLVFTDGTEAKINLSKNGDLCEKIQEGGNYLLTIEDGLTTSGKAWFAVRDVLATGGMPAASTPTAPEKVKETPPQTHKPTPPVDPTMPLNGPTIGMIINNSTILVVARIKAGVGKADPASIKTDLEYFNKYFEEMIRSGKLWMDF